MYILYVYSIFFITVYVVLYNISTATKCQLTDGQLNQRNQTRSIPAGITTVKHTRITIVYRHFKNRPANAAVQL